MVVEHGDLGVTPDARPVGEPQRDVLVSSRIATFIGTRSATKNSARAPAITFGAFFIGMWPADLIQNQHCFRDLPRVAFGIVDRLKWSKGDTDSRHRERRVSAPASHLIPRILSPRLGHGSAGKNSAHANSPASRLGDLNVQVEVCCRAGRCECGPPRHANVTVR